MRIVLIGVIKNSGSTLGTHIDPSLQEKCKSDTLSPETEYYSCLLEHVAELLKRHFK